MITVNADNIKLLANIVINDKLYKVMSTTHIDNQLYKFTVRDDDNNYLIIKRAVN